MADDSHWIERAQSLEVQLGTLRAQLEPMKERMRALRENLCAKERSDGSFTIDFVKLADRLGLDGALELRKAIDERWRISGEPGKKPRVKVKAAA